MKIINSIMTKNPCYKANKKISVKGLMIHSVGVPQPNASVFVNTWNSPSFTRACVHAFIDGNSGDVYQTLPWNHRGWHGGGSSNNTHIGVEMCEPSTIKYTTGSSWVETGDGSSTKAVVTRTYNSAVELFAMLCKEYNLNPLGDGVIVSHSEGYRLGVSSNHGDPEHLWNKFGYSIAGFRNDIKNFMNQTDTDDSDSSSLYRVQTGAFSNKSNAVAYANKLKASGFDIYIFQENGLYKLQAGAFKNKGNADALLAKLKSAGVDAFIRND